MFLCSVRGFRATLVESSRHLLLARSVLGEQLLVLLWMPFSYLYPRRGDRDI